MASRKGRAPMGRRKKPRISRAASIKRSTTRKAGRRKAMTRRSTARRILPSSADTTRPSRKGKGAASRPAEPLPRGIRTRQKAYYGPILSGLSAKGGRSDTRSLMTDLEKRMRRTLKPVDYEPVASDPSKPRWRNAAQWARNSMIKEGLLKRGSPVGVWEITAAGRRWLGTQGRAPAGRSRGGASAKAGQRPSGKKAVRRTSHKTATKRPTSKRRTKRPAGRARRGR